METRLRKWSVDFDDAEAMIVAQMYLDRAEAGYIDSDEDTPTKAIPPTLHRKSKSESFAASELLSPVKDEPKRSSLPAPKPPPLPAPPLPPDRYCYKPLRGQDDIRLISISTSLLDDNLYFQLTRQNRYDCPTYEAVSYTWGSTARTKTIYDAFTGMALPVTENCEAALRALHQKDKHRRFWLDAISINQDDIEERSHQVTIMDDVFRNAKRTIAYLGPEDRHTLALSRWPEMSKLILGYDKATYRKASRAAFEHLEAILRRSWFMRAWVVQEVLLSKHLHIQAGSHIIDFAEACQLLREHGNHRNHSQGVLDIFIRYGNEPEIKARQARRQAWAGPRSASWRISALQAAFPAKGYLKFSRLFMLLMETAAYKCRDPRDKLYALISLFDGDPPAELMPDYSLSVEAVYANITRYLICSEDTTLALSAANGVLNPTLPSWVIDWRNPPMIELLLRNDLGDRTKYRAGIKRDYQHIPHVTSKGDVLRLRGMRIARINGVSSTLGNTTLEFKELVWYRESGFTIPTAKETCHRVPYQSRGLDVVVIFIGFEVPFLLREMEAGWQLIGECLIDDMMHGQALTWVDRGKIEDAEPVWPLEDFMLV